MATACLEAPAQLTSVPRSPRYYSLDIWRGVACLMVIAYHSNFYLTGKVTDFPWNWISSAFDRMWLGVPIFFVISGYCISATADAERRKKRGTVSYFKRRFRRIFPPYWITVAVFALLASSLELLVPQLFSDSWHRMPPPYDLNAAHWLGNLTLTESWIYTVHDKSGYLYFLGHAWSLCYEEQFYAVTGLLLAICPRWFFRGVVAVTLITFATRKSGLFLEGCFLDGYWFMFAAGIGVYWAVNYASPLGRRVLTAVLICATAYVARAYPLLLLRHVNETQRFFSALVFALLLLALHRWDLRLYGSRWLKPLLFCGTMCYSLYLVHWPIAKGISHGAVLLGITAPSFTICLVVPLCFAVSITAARAFHILVERRFMNAR